MTTVQLQCIACSTNWLEAEMMMLLGEHLPVALQEANKIDQNMRGEHAAEP